MRDVALNPMEFVLAPVGRRLLAGTIDALPVLIAGGISGWQYSRVNEVPLDEPWLALLENMAPAQIVVERSMYSDAVDAQGNRTVWAAGTGALGTRIR